MPCLSVGEPGRGVRRTGSTASRGGGPRRAWSCSAARRLPSPGKSYSAARSSRPPRCSTTMARPAGEGLPIPLGSWTRGRALPAASPRSLPRRARRRRRARSPGCSRWAGTTDPRELAERRAACTPTGSPSPSSSDGRRARSGARPARLHQGVSEGPEERSGGIISQLGFLEPSAVEGGARKKSSMIASAFVA